MLLMHTESDSPARSAAPAPRSRSRPRRCNADYRWTVPKAMAFLEALAHCGEVAEAARAVGMSRQAAYRLRARLAGGPLGEGFEIARRQGLQARAARSRSRWEGPGLDAVAGPRQGDGAGRQGDGSPPQGDIDAAKVTQTAPS
jgi:hypothetical protein